MQDKSQATDYAAVAQQLRRTLAAQREQARREAREFASWLLDDLDLKLDECDAGPCSEQIEAAFADFDIEVAVPATCADNDNKRTDYEIIEQMLADLPTDFPEEFSESPVVTVSDEGSPAEFGHEPPATQHKPVEAEDQA